MRPAAAEKLFSVVDAVLLEPLPYRAPDRLAMLWSEDPTTGLREGRSALTDVEQWRDQSEAFEDLATFDAVSTTLTSADGAEQIVGAGISRNLLAVLGVQPVPARLLGSLSIAGRTTGDLTICLGTPRSLRRNARGRSQLSGGVNSSTVGK